ncbi:MAG: hypothetical protein IT210_24555 [Armatimonadetes bacterium]|nr:hypothetical protein [Armatimonadota bacterium]
MKMRFCLMLLAGLSFCPATFAADFYVAESGKDTWSGRLPAPALRKADGPFVTLPAALNAVRLLRAGSKEPSLRPASSSRAGRTTWQRRWS